LTLFNQKTFTVPASGGTKEACAKEGHPWADRKGRCIRCSAQIRDLGFSKAEGEHEVTGE
jgi:hypothetical protein